MSLTNFELFSNFAGSSGSKRFYGGSIGILTFKRDHCYQYVSHVYYTCICGGDIESINHFFLLCSEYCEARQTLFGNIQSIDKMLLSQNESSLTYLLLYGNPKRNSNVNAFILNSAIEFKLSSGRFNELLFNGA